MLQIYAFSFNLSIILLYFLAFLTPITKKNSLAADFPHLLEAISIILTSVVIFLSCLPLCYSGPPFSLSNARRFCRRDNHRSLWFSSGLFSRMLRHCRCPLSCARRFHRRVSLLSRVLIITTKRHALLHTPLPSPFARLCRFALQRTMNPFSPSHHRIHYRFCKHNK